MHALAAMLFALVLAGCATASRGSLYADLGAQSGIERIVDGFLDNIAADDRVFELFRETDIDRFRSKLIEQLCEVSGGPCVYSGDSMEKSHGGMHITESQFNAVVEDLILAMERERVPVAAQNRLLAVLAPMRPQIIHR
jgi:hemoglobin